MTTDAHPTTLTEFLLAQLDADGAVAAVLGVGEKWVLDPDRHTMDGDEEYWDVDGINGGWVAQVGEPLDAAHIVLNDPAHVLAQIAAVRAVVKLHGPLDLWYDTERLVCAACLTDRRGFRDEWEPDPFPCPTLRALAQPYTGRAGWDESWAL